MLKFVFLTVALLLLQGASADLEEVPADDAIYDSYRLPTAITPENYRLEVITHLNDTEGFIFRGIVWITVRTFQMDKYFLCKHSRVLRQSWLSPKVTATLFSYNPKTKQLQVAMNNSIFDLVSTILDFQFLT